MVVERPKLLDLGRALAGLAPRTLDIFQVLPASGIRTEDGSDEGQRASYAVGTHLAQSVGEIRMPVSIPPIDWKPRPIMLKFGFKARDQRPVLIVDGTLAAEMIIV